MGVPGLQTYVEQRASSACKKVNILKEAKKINEKSCWQRKKSVTEDDLQKVLIVDLLGLARKPYVGLNPWFGGDFVQYKDNWRKLLLKKFQEKGIGLVFVSKSTRNSRDRGKKEIENFVKPAFEQLKKGKTPQPDILNNSVLPKCGLENFIRHELNQQLYIIHTGDQDRQIIHLAIQYKAFGILVQDSDFFCQQFPLQISIYSAKELDLDTLDTIAFGKKS